MTTTAYFDSYDAETQFGFYLSDQEGQLQGAAPVPQEIEVPQMRGAIFAGPDRIEVRQFVLSAFLDGVNQATVRTNLRKLQALLLDGNLHNVRLADWNTVQIAARCVRFEVDPDPPKQISIPVNLRLTFRAPNPYWQDTSGQSINFTTTHTDMPQGTAPGEPVITSPAGPLTTPELRGYDHNDVQLWTCTLASLGSNHKYRINTAPGIMSIEKSTDGGSTWAAADDAITAGRFPMVLPSDGTAFQTSAWPKLYASTGTWNAAYNRQWR